MSSSAPSRAARSAAGACRASAKETRSMETHLPPTTYPRFHLAFPVTDLDAARRFYGEFLGCAEGRTSDDWVDFDFFGHQIVAHKVAAKEMADAHSLVDGDSVPVRHFGVILDLPGW